ncbi:hypothetical protein VPH35_051329 [Triticum aestivum]
MRNWRIIVAVCLLLPVLAAGYHRFSTVEEANAALRRDHIATGIGHTLEQMQRGQGNLGFSSYFGFVFAFYSMSVLVVAGVWDHLTALFGAVDGEYILAFTTMLVISGFIVATSIRFMLHSLAP